MYPFSFLISNYVDQVHVLIGKIKNNIKKVLPFAEVQKHVDPN